MTNTPGFLTKIRMELDLTPVEMARAMGLKPHEFSDIQDKARAELADYDKHEMWALLQECINRKLAGALAAQEQLRVKRDKDRRQRVIRTAQSREIR